MTPTELLASLSGLIVLFGGGSKWLLAHIAANAATSALKESEARSLLSEHLHNEIRILRIELAEMHIEKKLYLRRIFQLERFIHAQPGIDIPDMEGWPPL